MNSPWFGGGSASFASRPPRRWRLTGSSSDTNWIVAFLWLSLALGIFGCGKSQTQVRKVTPAPTGISSFHIDLPQTETRLGTAVVVLVDTSGSMEQPVRDQSGQLRPKYEIAREALERIVQHTARWKKQHADANLQMGIFHFASRVSEVLPMSAFDDAKSGAALKRIPRPKGGTAIGRALEEGFKALYGSGCARKFVVCITDGENTSGPPPDGVARQLYAQTNGAVELHFVAFDTSASQFKFLSGVNGHAVEAADGSQLQAELTKVYESRILVEKEESPK
jgi:Mg-chelatase subunit ChlD